MKKILFILFGFAAFCLILPSCKNKVTPIDETLAAEVAAPPVTETSEIDFSKLQTIHSSVAVFGEATGYIFDTVEAYVFNEASIGYFMKPIKVLLYVDEWKQIRFDCYLPMVNGIVALSLPIYNVGITSGKFTSKELKITVGGENRVVVTNDYTNLFVFDSAEDAANLEKTLRKWSDELEKSRRHPVPNSPPKIKGTDI